MNLNSSVIVSLEVIKSIYNSPVIIWLNNICKVS